MQRGGRSQVKRQAAYFASLDVFSKEGCGFVGHQICFHIRLRETLHGIVCLIAGEKMIPCTAKNFAELIF